MQKPGDAFVQKPDKMETPEDILFCWRDPERVCSGDCTAFDPAGADPGLPTRSTCVLVNAARQASSALVTLARSVSATGADQPAPRVRT
jgi:hypothetical protein